MPISSGLQNQNINIFSSGAFTGTMPVTSSLANPVWVTGTTTVTGTLAFSGSVTAVNNSVAGTGSATPGTATLVGGYDDNGIVQMAHVDAGGALQVYISSSDSASQVWVTSSQANPIWTTGTVTVTNEMSGTVTVTSSLAAPVYTVLSQSNTSGSYAVITDPLKGTKAWVGDDRDLRINDQGFPTIHVRFNSTFFDSTLLEEDIVGAGVRTSDKSECILSPGDTASGSLAAISSHKQFVFAGGRLSNFNTVVRFDNYAATGVSRKFGYIDLNGSSGLYFELADGVLYAASSYNGTVTRSVIAGYPPTNGNYYKYEIHNTGFRVNYIIGGVQVYTTSSITTLNHPNFDHTELPVRYVTENTGTASAIGSMAVQYFACHNPNIKGALIVDEDMNKATVSEIGNLRVAPPPYVKLYEAFESNTINGSRWQSDIVGGASATFSSTIAELGTDGVSGSRIEYKTKQLFPGSSNTQIRETAYTLALGAVTDVNVVRQWGNFNGTTDGAIFRASGTTLETVTIIAGVETARTVDPGQISVFDDDEFYNYRIRRHGSNHIWFIVNDRVVDVRSSVDGPIYSTDNDQPYFGIINKGLPTNPVTLRLSDASLSAEGSIVHRLAGSDDNGLTWEARVSPSGALVVTSSINTPIWVTSSDTNAGLKQAADLAQYVTSSQLLPVWVTSTDTNAGLKQAADLAQYVTSSQALPVWITGAVDAGVIATGRNDIDIIAPSGTGITPSSVFLYGWNKTAWERIETDPSTGDNVQPQAGGLLDTDAHVRVWNGVGFDRLRGDTEGLWVKITASVPLTMSITGVLPVSQTNIPSVVVVTATQASPVWTTSTAPNSDLKLAADNAQYVTSSEALPVWVTGTTNIGNVDGFGNLPVQISNGASRAVVGTPGSQQAGSSLSGLAAFVAEYQTTLPTNTANRIAWLEVDQNGRLFTTLSGTVVAVSQTNAASQNGLVGVTGAVQVTNTTGTLNVAQTGAFVITGSVTTTPSAPVVVSQGLSSVGSRVWDVQLVDPVLSSALRPQQWDQNVPTFAIQVAPAVSTSSLAATNISENRLTGIRVDLQGRQYITLSGTIVAVSQTNPVALTGVSVNGLVGVSGTVAITSGTVTAHADGLMGVSGTVAITSGVLTSITNPVVVTSTSANPVWTTGTTTVTGALTASVALTGALPVTGLVGVSGAVAISSGVLTSITNNVHIDGLVGVTGAVAVTSGVLTSITNPVTVTSSFTSPVYVSSTIANPVMVSGAVTIATTGTLTVSQSNMPLVLPVTSAIGSPVYVSSTITNPVNVTASQASPVTVATTGTWPVTGTVTIAVTSALQVAWPPNTGSISGTVTAEQTGAFVVTGSATVAQTGTWVVSATNPVLAPKVEQTGAWVITGTVTQNVPAFPSVSSTINAAGQTVTLPIGTAVGVAIRISGSYTGTLKFYASFNGGNTYHRVEGYSPEVGDELVTSGPTDVNGIWQPYDIAGATHIRVSSTLWTAGNASIEIYTNNKSAAPFIFTRENGDVTPSYGVQIAGDDAGTFRYIKVDQSGALFVSASQNRPVWVTGSITSEFSASGTFVAVENSVGGDGQIAPVSATLIGGHVTGNLQSINVTSNGTVVITGNMEAHQSAAFVVTSTQANPVWITGSIATTAGTQIVTSTLADPVWVTGTTTVTGTITATGTVNVNQTGAFQVAGTVTAQGLVGVTGTVNVANPSGVFNVAQSGAWVVTSTIANPVNITASQASPVTVAVTGVLPVTGTVTIGLTSSLSVAMTGVTVNQTAAWQVAGTVTAHADGLMGVSGTVAVTSGVLTSITNPVVVTSAFASPVYVSSTSGNPVNTVGLHGVSGTVAITSGVLTTLGTITNNVHTDGLMGVSGTVAITSGTITGITNVVVVTGALATPVWVAISGNMSASFTGVMSASMTGVTVNQTSTWQVALTGATVNGLVGVSGAVAITSGVLTSITNPVVITATVASPAYVTSTIASPVNVTASSGNPVSVTIVGGSSAGKQYLTGTDLNGGTGTLMIGVDATNVARAAFMTVDGFLAVSQTNPPGAGTQVVTSTLANPVWVTGTTTVTGALTASIALTGALPVIVTGSSVNGLVGVSGTVAITSGVLTTLGTITNPVTVTSTVGNAVYVTSTLTNLVNVGGLMGVSGTVAITSGVLTSITNPVVVTSALASPLWITSSAATIVTVSQSNTPAGTQVVTGTVVATGSTTPSDAFANPTTALLALALNAVWDGTQWVRQRGGVSGTIVQTRPPTVSTTTAQSITGTTSHGIMAANTNRLGATIASAGTGTNPVFIKLGAAAALNSWTVRLAQNSYYEVPFGYNGAISACTSASHQVTIIYTELTP